MIRKAKNKNNQAAFVILYAVLVAGVVSLSGVLLANIIVKQLFISSLGRESQFAYYEANAAQECLLFGRLQGMFHEFNSGGGVEDPLTPLNLNCLDEVGDLTPDISGNRMTWPTFQTKIGANSCAKIDMSSVFSGGNNEVLVTAAGVNQCDAGENYPRLVEKVIYRQQGLGLQ